VIIDMQIFHRLIIGTLAEFINLDPSTKKEGTRFETETGSSYIIENGLWKNENPLLTTFETVYTKFMPATDQSGLTFGDAFWNNTFSEMVGDGSMLYYTKNLTTAFTGGYFGVTDFARPDLLPKIQIMFKCDDASVNSNVMVGLTDDSALSADINTNSGWFPDAKTALFMGAKGGTDTNWQIYHNDAISTLSAVDTGITRDTGIYDLTIQYLTDSSANLVIADETGTQLYQNIFTSEMPLTTDEISFRGGITNNDTGVSYGLYIYDHVYLEKRVPMPTGVVV
jgi:hypothetical protein